MEDAERSMDTIVRRLKSRGYVLMLDFDGVLAPIVKRPQDARMSERARDALNTLKRQVPVAIISGRTLHSVRRQARISGVTYSGSHGLEWVMKGKVHRGKIPAHSMARFKKARKDLLSIVAPENGFIVEEKRNAVAVNYRALTPARGAAFSRAAHALMAPYVSSGAIRVLDHLNTFEIIAEGGWTKGEVARHIYKQMAKRGATPIFIGDSLTDEDAFQELREGITIRVGPSKKSSAQYFFMRRDQVDDFLEMLLSI